MENNFKPGQTIYHNNQECSFDGYINENDAVVTFQIGEVHIEDSYSEPIETQIVVSVSNLRENKVDLGKAFEEDKRAHEARLYKITEEHRQALNKTLKQYEDIKKRIEKISGLENLADMVEGNITHIVTESYWSFDIIEFKETMTDDRHHKRYRMFSLFADTKENSLDKFFIHISRWHDGSGEWVKAHPCKSYEEAKEKCLLILEKKLKEKEFPNESVLLNIKNKHGISSDLLEKRLQEHEATRAEEKKKKIADLEKSLAQARGEG